MGEGGKEDENEEIRISLQLLRDAHPARGHAQRNCFSRSLQGPSGPLKRHLRKRAKKRNDVPKSIRA